MDNPVCDITNTHKISGVTLNRCSFSIRLAVARGCECSESAHGAQCSVCSWGERMSQRSSTGCALDPRGCINLECILSAFGAPISEEQAWALCYTSVQCFFSLRDDVKSKVTLSTSLKHVMLHKDGFVHEETFKPSGNQGRRTIPVCVSGSRWSLAATTPHRTQTWPYWSVSPPRSAVCWQAQPTCAWPLLHCLAEFYPRYDVLQHSFILLSHFVE